MLTIITIIAILVLIGVIILYEVRQTIKKLPAKIIESLFAPLQNEINNLRSQIEEIKNAQGSKE